MDAFLNRLRRGLAAAAIVLAVGPACSGGDGGGGVVVSIPTQLVVVMQPLGSTDGLPLGAQPRVEIRDAAGALVKSATNAITASIASGGGTLSGTTTVNAALGVAAFTDLAVSGTGNFALTFSAAGLVSATSAGFVMLAAAPVQVGMLTQPVGGISGIALPTQPSVELRDAGGARMVNSSANVTVALASGTGALSGTLTVAAQNGVATFANLTINGGGAHTLLFTSGSATAATSAPFSMALPASITVGSSPLILNVGAATGLTAVVRDGAGAVIPNVPVTFVSRTTNRATVNGTGTVTGVAKGQSVIVATVMHTAGVGDSVLAVVADPAGAVLRAGLAAFSIRRDTTFTLSIYVDTRTVTPNLASGTVAISWSTNVLDYQSHTAGGQISPVVNASSAATGALQLSFADPAGATGLVEILRITFQARSTVTAAGTLAFAATEMSAADFSDLLPKLVQVSQPLVVR